MGKLELEHEATNRIIGCLFHVTTLACEIPNLIGEMAKFLVLKDLKLSSQKVVPYPRGCQKCYPLETSCTNRHPASATATSDTMVNHQPRPHGRLGGAISQ